MSEQDQQNQESEKELGFFATAASVLASFFGVQSSEKRDRDFKRGNVKMFIIVGILMTVVWYGVIAAVVSVVLDK
jgi:K+-sensing histidine kinase KdpD